jgi:hypothetical protein
LRPVDLPTTTSHKSKHHARPSLLSGDSAYQPLTGGAASFSSQQPPIYNPTGPAAYETGGYHDRQGLPTREILNSSGGAKSGTSRMYIPNTTWTWSFMLVAIFQAAINLALQCFVFGKFQASLFPGAQNSDVSYTIPTYLALFIFGFLYQLVLVWDALRLKNTIQVIGVCIYNVGMVIYASVEISQVDEAVELLEHANPPSIQVGTADILKPFLIAAPCVIALGTVLLAGIAWKLYDEFAWTIYKHISADLRLKRRFLTYQVRFHMLNLFRLWNNPLP